MEKEHPDSIYLTKEVMQDLRANQIGYYAAVTAMDAGIGRIIEELERLGVREDTLVSFQVIMVLVAVIMDFGAREMVRSRLICMSLL